jgi:DNA topoisomerase-1
LQALDAKHAPRAAGKSVIAELGELPGIEGRVSVMDGRYGPYVTNGKVNATLPKGTDPGSLTPERAAELLQAKIAAGPTKRFKRTRRR